MVLDMTTPLANTLYMYANSPWASFSLSSCADKNRGRREKGGGTAIILSPRNGFLYIIISCDMGSDHTWSGRKPHEIPKPQLIDPLDTCTCSMNIKASIPL